MKSNLSRKNIALLGISVIIFIALLAVYIPLKIYINREESDSPVTGKVSFNILITRNLSGALDQARSGNRNPDRTVELVTSSDNRESLLLIDFIEIVPGISAGEERPAGFPTDKLKKIGYRAVAPLILRRDSMKFLSGPLWLFDLPLPLVSANIVATKESSNNLRRWLITDIEARADGNSGSREIRIGIFSVSNPDSIRAEYSRFNHYNLISPGIAALEAINRMIKEECHLIIALCDAGTTEILDDLPGIDLILEMGEKNFSRRSKDALTVSFSGEEDGPVNLMVTYSKDSLRAAPGNYEPGKD
ncbi:MAG: hypothetical protein GF417_13580 [Candidatus Latescibacteria bacterium]|nr:hypothetical protein [bacterium]MBD3425460.1 hypothetical protein [Candidatus Latescibacterota bacterium]